MINNLGERKGIHFVLPDLVQDKQISVVEVGPYDESGLAKEINKFLGTRIERLQRINSYVLVHPRELTGVENLLSGKPFVDPIIHRAALNSSLAKQLAIPYDAILQSNLNPGTSDAEGDTCLRQTLLALNRQIREGDIGFYSKQYLLGGNLEMHQLEAVSAFLANPNLNVRYTIPRNLVELCTVELEAPIVVLKPDITVREYDILKMSDKELLELSSTRKLAATLEEMHQYVDMFSDPEFIRKRKEVGLTEKTTDVELELWFGLRSEHCFHKELNAKITLEDRVNDPVFRRAFEKGWLAKDKGGNYSLERGIFKTFIEEPAYIICNKLEKRGKNWIADMFRDNAGTVYYDENFMFCIKFETHNSPSNKEPIQGAKTGIDGVNRDIFGNMLGTFEAIANFFYYCTGYPDYRGWLPLDVKHPYTLFKGITQGVREGGNESQIPTLGGGAIFDPRYAAKVLVYCGTIGFSPVKSPDGISYLGKHPHVGDLILVAGQPVGRDGIHGATESSLSASSYISLGHVQADFSFMQVKMSNYLLSAARDMLIESIGDCGAMGISVAVELGQHTNGLVLDLEKHPRKYLGIQPWEVTVSETQDRMVPIISPKNRNEFLLRARLHDVPVTELGKLTDSGYAHLNWGDKTVAYIPLDKLSNKEPRKQMQASWNGVIEKEAEVNKRYSLEESLCMVMEQPDVASKEWLFRQKDSSVKGATIQGPLIGLKQEVEADATIQKPLETEGKDYGAIAYSLGISPKLSDLDAYHSAQNSFVDMVGKIIAVGGSLPDMNTPKWDSWAVCGNYCQPNSESRDTLTKESGEHNLASFLREAIGIREAEEALNIPVISGKDSMKCSCFYEVDKSFNLDDVPADLRRHIILVEKDNKRFIEIHDPGSYLASCAVKIDDYRKCVNSSFKQEGDRVYILGTTKNHLGASEYLSAVGYKEQAAPLENGYVAKADFDEFVKVAGALHEAIDSEIVASSSYVHNGGIGAALSKAALAGEKGAKVNLGAICTDGSCKLDEQLFYSKTPGRFIVTVAPGSDAARFEQMLNDRGVAYGLVGNVAAKDLTVRRLDGTTDILNLEKVKKHYQEPLSFGLQEMKDAA